jgi:hypothetical protein
MNEFLCHTGRTFTPDEFKDHAEAVQKSMARKLTEVICVSDVNLGPVIEPQELVYLMGLSQFYRIPNRVLFELVRVATGFKVCDRWVAIRVILTKSIPIPVSKPLADVQLG